MQYIVIAHDYKDKDALNRRMKAREDHMALGDKMVAEGKALYGVALFDDQGSMNGSVYVVDFPSKKELDEWIKIEPYVIGKVWEKIKITPCKVGPSFINK
jgi:hypothetical protein